MPLDVETLKNFIDTQARSVSKEEAVEFYDELVSHCDAASDALQEEIDLEA